MSFEANKNGSADILPVICNRHDWLDSLDGLASETYLDEWSQQPRFRARLVERLRLRHNLASPASLPSLPPSDLQLSQLAPDTIGACRRAAGVIAHANAFIREIQAARVLSLRSRFGDDLHALALRHRGRPHPDTVEMVSTEDLDLLEAAIDRDGHYCLNQWWQYQPPAWQDWLQLGWAWDMTLDDRPVDVAAVEIARLAVESLSSPSPSGLRGDT